MAVLANLADPFHKAFLEQASLAGLTAGMEIRPAIIRDSGHLEIAFTQVAGETVDAVIVQPSLPIQRVADLALHHRIPSACSSRPFAVAGGLLAYFANSQDQVRKTASYVDRILKGAKPADLPVEQPVTFELLLNTKTAKALAIMIPSSLLARADELIE